MSSPIIQAENLVKHYTQFKKDPGLAGTIRSLFKREYFTVKAVDDISFSIEEGEFVGFIGPNGAGKTTTLKCLSGLLYPTDGKLEVLGYTPFDRRKSFLKQIALVMGQKNQLWWDLPASDTFSLNKEIYEISDDAYKKTIAELADMLDLHDVMDIQVRKLSLGQRMKCGLVASLMHSPRVLFLDEPTIGLDVTMQKRMRDFFRDFNEKYCTTVILTSHYMEDVRELCKRVIIIDNGKIIYDGELGKIVKKYIKDKHVSLRFLKSVERADVEKYGTVVDFTGDSVTLSVPRNEVPRVTANILKTLPVDDMDIREVDLDDVIRLIFEVNAKD